MLHFNKAGTYIAAAGVVLLCTGAVFGAYLFRSPPKAEEYVPVEIVEINPSAETENKKSDYIKWVQFDATYDMLLKAYKYDVQTYGEDVHLDMVQLLAYSVAKNWGNVDSKLCLSYIDECADRLKSGESISDITEGIKYYNFYHEAYTAVLGGIMGEKNGEYGLIAYSPIAAGYGYSHYDDFGASRSYGFKRTHKGHDLLGAVGTPVIAVESGIVEAAGWNTYGGWRIGIRSEDKKRYYYYAHLRKDHPFAKGIEEGAKVEAGQVIGYLGMTGYSTKENVNNITTPHLHFGLELVFDESQKESANEIWVDVYDIVKLLNKNRSEVVYDEESGEFVASHGG